VETPPRQAAERSARRLLLAAPCAAIALGCSLQNFDYLTRGGGGSDASFADGSGFSEPDATGETAPGDAAETPETSAPHDAATQRTDSPTETVDARAPAGGDAGPINYIVNPDFAASTLQGWTVNPPSAAQMYVFTQAPVGSAYTPQGQAYELATYAASDSFTVDVSQTLTNLPNGMYALTAWFNRGANNQAYIYANGCGGSDTAGDGGPDGGAGEIVNIPLTSSTGWEQVTIPGIRVIGGNCQVGLHVDASATDWLNADGFSFSVWSADDGGAGDAGGD